MPTPSSDQHDTLVLVTGPTAPAAAPPPEPVPTPPAGGAGPMAPGLGQPYGGPGPTVASPTAPVLATSAPYPGRWGTGDPYPGVPGSYPGGTYPGAGAPGPAWTAPRWQPVRATGEAWPPAPAYPTPVGPPVLVMRNNPAVVGATLGSVSLFLSLIPLLGIVAWVLAPIGLLTSVAGLLVGMARRVGRVGAVWGIATSGIALMICMAWTSLVLAL